MVETATSLAIAISLAIVNVVTVVIPVQNSIMHVQGILVKIMELVTRNHRPISMSVIALLDTQV